jgi:ubiquinone/menaquinone biosynthesis C-methylase UbiE
MNYDRLAADYAATRGVHPGILAQLTGAVQSLQAREVLEAGCGTGNYAAALQVATGACVLGVEPSQGMLGFAHRAGVPVCQSVAEALPFSAGAFDLVYTVDVVHHLRDVPRYLGEARRVLRRGGFVCTATDSERILATRQPLAVYWPETVASELARYHPIPRLRAWMEAAGFTNVGEEEVEFAYPLHDAEPYRRRAYSTLQRIPDAAWQAGLARLEADLARGPVSCVARYTLVWGTALAA